MSGENWQQWLPMALLVATAVIIGFLIWLIILSVKLHQLRRLLNLVEGLAPGQPLDHLLEVLMEKVKENRALLEDLEGRHGRLVKELSRCLRRVGLVRFDAFTDVAGEQSFAVALLDNNGDGVVITSLAGRSESRCYAKPVTGQTSPYRLTEEEREAIKKAMEAERGVQVG